MGTYDPKKVQTDYGNGSITVEQAVGHALQHVNLLYEQQASASRSRSELRNQINSLEQRMLTIQADVKRLTALVKQS